MTRARFLLGLSVLPGLWACGGSDSGDSTPELPPDSVAQEGMAERAVLLVIDGARLEETFGDGDSDASGEATEEILPEIRSTLFEQGGVAAPAYVTGPAFTSAAHVDLITGVRQYYAMLASGDGYGPWRPDHPNLFERLRAERGLAESQVAFAANTTLMGDLVWGWAPGFGEDVAGAYHAVESSDGSGEISVDDRDVIEQVKASLTDDDATLVVANLHQSDRAGHGTPLVYANAVAAVDGPITQLWGWLQDAVADGDELPLVVIVADHGRHRAVESAQPWAHHGCSCTGCREVPLLVLGPGIAPGTRATRPYLLEDVHHTVAWLLGVNMPYSSGLALDDFLQGQPAVPVRSGDVALAAHGELLAWQAWDEHHEARSSVLVDGELLASGALHVEAPSVIQGDGVDYACWRQLELSEGADHWPWEAHCARRVVGGDWEDLGLETGELLDGWQAQLGLDDAGRLWVVHQQTEQNPLLFASTPEFVGYRAALWDPDSQTWTNPDTLAGQGGLPSQARLFVSDGVGLVAWAVAESDSAIRSTRHIALQMLEWVDGQPRWQLVRAFHAADADEPTLARLERPAVGEVGGRPTVVAVGYSDQGTTLLATSTDGEPAMGWRWSELRTLDATGRVFPHLSPAISSDGWAYWARRSEGGDVELCRADDASGSPSCVDTERAWIDSLAPGAGGAWISSSDGDLAWTASWVAFEGRSGGAR